MRHPTGTPLRISSVVLVTLSLSLGCQGTNDANKTGATNTKTEMVSNNGGGENAAGTQDANNAGGTSTTQNTENVPGITPPNLTHPAGQGDGAPGSGGSLPSESANTNVDVGDAPGTGEQTPDNVTKLLSVVGNDSVPPTPQTELSLNVDQAQGLLQGSWVSGFSHEQTMLRKAIELGLKETPDAIEGMTELPQDIKDVALEIAANNAKSEEQGSQSPKVQEYTSILGTLVEPPMRAMTISGESISYTGEEDAIVDEERGGPVTSQQNRTHQFSVTAASGNQVTISSSNQNGEQETKVILFLTKSQIWVPKGSGLDNGQGTVFNKTD